MGECQYCRGKGGCRAMSPDTYICTREPGHVGDHVACGTLDCEVRKWPQKNPLDYGRGTATYAATSISRWAAATGPVLSVPGGTHRRHEEKGFKDEPTWPPPTDSERAQAATYMPGRATGHTHAWRWFELGWDRDDEPVLRSLTWSTHTWPVGAPAVGYDYSAADLGYSPRGPMAGIPPGLYAYKTRERAIDEHANSFFSSTAFPRFLAEVALWGTVVEHEHGYRARYGYPVKLYHARGSMEKWYAARKLGERYGVPVEQVETFEPGREDTATENPWLWLRTHLGTQPLIRRGLDNCTWVSDADVLSQSSLGNMHLWALFEVVEQDPASGMTKIRPRDVPSAATAARMTRGSSTPVGTTTTDSKKDAVDAYAYTMIAMMDQTFMGKSVTQLHYTPEDTYGARPEENDDDT